jgi:hypothetical protein
VTLAFGLTLLLFGLISTVAFVVVGLLLVIWAIIGWIGELSDAPKA